MPNLLLFLSLATVLTLLVLTKPRAGFLLLLGGLIVFYMPFTQDYLFTVGSAYIYFGDVAVAALSVSLLISFLRKRFPVTPRSARSLLLLFAWGIIAVARGLPRYGYSAIGEARWYILPILYYFYVITTFRSKQHIRLLVKWFVVLLVVMIPLHAVSFYFLGGKEAMPPESWADQRTVFRFINATESLLVVFCLIGLLVYYVFGGITKHRALILALIVCLLAVTVIIQIRSIWLAAAAGIAAVGGLATIRFVLKKLPLQGVLLGHGALLLLVLLSVVAVHLDAEIYRSIARSGLFFRDPMADPTGAWRLEGWQQELETALKSPLIGQGLGGYSEWFDGRQWQRVAIHNDYIMYFSKFGVVGLLLLAAALGSWYAEIADVVRFEGDRYWQLMMRSLQVCVFMHMVFASFFTFSTFFWILLGIGTVLVREKRSNHIARDGSPGAPQTGYLASLTLRSGK